MTKLFVLDLENETMIKILSIRDVGLGEEPIKGSLEAFFPCSITWCSNQIDTHVAEKSFKLQKIDSVYINAYGVGNITPGLYHKLQVYNGRFILEKVSN